MDRRKRIANVLNKSYLQVSWVRHNNVSLISVGKYKYIKDERFRIVHEHHDEDWILAIKSVKKADQGVYECQVNTSPLQRQKFYLKTVGKYWQGLFDLSWMFYWDYDLHIFCHKSCISSDPYTEIVGGKDLFIDQHSSINLTCTVHSPEPPAHIFWMKNGRVRIIT